MASSGRDLRDETPRSQVSHSCRTVLQSLSPDDRLAIVTYSDQAQVRGCWGEELQLQGGRDWYTLHEGFKRACWTRAWCSMSLLESGFITPSSALSGKKRRRRSCEARLLFEIKTTGARLLQGLFLLFGWTKPLALQAPFPHWDLRDLRDGEAGVAHRCSIRSCTYMYIPYTV